MRWPRRLRTGWFGVARTPWSAPGSCSRRRSSTAATGMAYATFNFLFVIISILPFLTK